MALSTLKTSVFSVLSVVNRLLVRVLMPAHLE